MAEKFQDHLGGSPRLTFGVAEERTFAHTAVLKRLNTERSFY